MCGLQQVGPYGTRDYPESVLRLQWGSVSPRPSDPVEGRRLHGDAGVVSEMVQEAGRPPCASTLPVRHFGTPREVEGGQGPGVGVNVSPWWYPNRSYGALSGARKSRWSWRKDRSLDPSGTHPYSGVVPLRVGREVEGLGP